MLSHLKKYPLSICIIAVIVYLSFFTPPKTDMGEIPGLDKLVHTCMYGGLCLVIWFEYLRSHRSINFIKVCIWGIFAPILMSGIIELLQANCTESRSGECLDFYANSLGAVLAAIIGFNILRPWLWK